MAFHDKQFHQELKSDDNKTFIHPSSEKFNRKTGGFEAPTRQYLYKPTPFASRIKSLSLLINLVAITAILMAGLSTWSNAIAQTTTATSEPLKLAALVRPNDLNSGGLLLPSKKPGYFVQAPRLATDVKINITGPIARTIVTQRFENPSKGWVEGLYVFPLPENSAVDTLKMQIGKRFIEGKIKPREEARRIYEQAKSEGKKAALLEQQRPNIFTNAVANIGPGETIVVQIEYQQTVKQDKGEFSLRFPMVVAPRYSPAPIVQTVSFNKNGENGFGQIDPVPDRDKIKQPVLDPETNALINPVTLKINLAAGFELDNVTSAYHKMDEAIEDGSTRSLTLQNKSVPADRDFSLSWNAKGAAPNAALFSENVKSEDYVLAFITPPSINPENLAKKNREAIFIIDNSGSMAGESIVQAKLALATALARLTPKDKFNIVRFDDTYELVFPTAVSADRENITRALKFVSALEAEGGTEMLPALSAALVDHNSGDVSRVRQVIFITDGAIGNEQQLFNAITSGRGRSRVFTVGIGSAPNSYFMTRAAELGRGTHANIGDLNEVKKRMEEFFEKLESPILTGLKAEFNGANVSDISPDPLPDLYAGEPIILAARIQSSGKLSGILNISGDFAGQPWEVNMDIANAAKRSGIGKLWARKRIASLEASRSYGFDISDVDKNIEKTALDHHLVSRLTSLVAVDVKKSRPGEEELTTKDMPANLPKGWVFDKVYGEAEADQAPTPRLQKTRALGQQRTIQVAQLMAAAPSPKASAQAAKARKKILLPQTATNAERMIILGVLLMLLATALLLLSAMWQGTGKVSRVEERKLVKRDFDKLP